MEFASAVLVDIFVMYLAARIAGAFELWKRLPEPRRGRVAVELKRIASSPGLSPDVTEIVTRSLAD